MSVVYHTSSQNFSRDVLDSSVPVLVDFYADPTHFRSSPCTSSNTILVVSLMRPI